MRQTFGFSGWDPEMADLISDEEDYLDELQREQRMREMADRTIEAREFTTKAER